MRYTEITYMVGGELDSVLYYTPVQEATNALSMLKSDASDDVEYVRKHPSGITICAEIHRDYVDEDEEEDEDEDEGKDNFMYTFYIPEAHPLFTIGALVGELTRSFPVSTKSTTTWSSFVVISTIEHQLRLQLRKLLTT